MMAVLTTVVYTEGQVGKCLQTETLEVPLSCSCRYKVFFGFLASY